MEHNNKFILCTDTFDEFSFEELKNALEENLKFLDFTTSHLRHEKIGQRNFQAFKILRSRLYYIINGLCSIPILRN